MLAFIKRVLKGSNVNKNGPNRVGDLTSEMATSNTKSEENIRTVHSEDVTKTILMELSQLTKTVNEIKKNLPNVE